MNTNKPNCHPPAISKVVFKTNTSQGQKFFMQFISLRLKELDILLGGLRLIINKQPKQQITHISQGMNELIILRRAAHNPSNCLKKYLFSLHYVIEYLLYIHKHVNTLSYDIYRRLHTLFSEEVNKTSIFSIWYRNKKNQVLFVS